MSLALALILGNLAATLFMAGMIWTVQVVHYPLFSAVGRDAFPSYEAAHQSRIGALLAVPWTVQVLTAVALVVWLPAGVALALAWAGVLVALALVVVTFTVFVPIHRSLAGEFAPSAHARLIDLNWIRTALWTGHAMIALAILVQHVDP